jgi:hypothetical protein
MTTLVNHYPARQMKTYNSHIAFLLVVCAAFHLGNAAAQVAHLKFQSQPGDPIGEGLTRDIIYTPNNGTFFFADVRRTLSSGEPAEIVFGFGLGETPFTLLFFGTDQLGIPMQPGFYPNAQRADFAAPGHPGLDVSFNHNGCNTLTGNFTVHEFTYSPLAGIQSFSVSFEQHCEGAPPALLGDFTFQAVPEPSPVTLFVLSSVGAFGIAAYRKRKS